MLKKLLFAAVLLPIMAFATAPVANRVSHTGERLLNRFWADLKTGNAKHVSTYMDPHFQAVHYFGATNKVGELAIIRGLNMDSYVLSDIIETRRGSMLILTYMAEVTEVLSGQPVEDTAPRMTTWKKEGHHWRLLTHANLVTPSIG